MRPLQAEMCSASELPPVLPAHQQLLFLTLLSHQFPINHQLRQIKLNLFLHPWSALLLLLLDAVFKFPARLNAPMNVACRGRWELTDNTHHLRFRMMDDDRNMRLSNRSDSGEAETRCPKAHINLTRSPERCTTTYPISLITQAFSEREVRGHRQEVE